MPTILLSSDIPSWIKRKTIFRRKSCLPGRHEHMLNVIDRNAYLILGSVETLRYNPEAYLSWLNGMIVFDILNPEERSALPAKMERVLQTQSILIFPEFAQL